jgi:hypothetical protein
MVTVLIVGKNSEITETKLKTFSIEEICKKAKVKTIDDYKRKHVWTVILNKQSYYIALYAKTDGRAGQENKYDFPPPVDSELYFGNCMLVSQKNATDANEVIDLSKATWELIYEELFGGFDDCMESEEESEDDMDGLVVGKSGYELDDFVVDDEETDDNEDEDEAEYETEEEIIEEPTKKAKKVSKKNTIKKAKEPNQEEYLGCDSELEEESYFS